MGRLAATRARPPTAIAATTITTTTISISTTRAITSAGRAEGGGPNAVANQNSAPTAVESSSWTHSSGIKQLGSSPAVGKSRSPSRADSGENGSSGVAWLIVVSLVFYVYYIGPVLWFKNHENQKPAIKDQVCCVIILLWFVCWKLSKG